MLPASFLWGRLYIRTGAISAISAYERQALAFHGVEFVLRHFDAVAALLRFIEQRFKSAAKVLVNCDFLERRNLTKPEA
jgi:hypothetical protein